MGLIKNEMTLMELLAIDIHCISIVSLCLIIYLTVHKNNFVTLFSIANIGQHCSKLFRLILFGFTMKNAPTWCCYLHAFTNFLTVGMESYIAMLFAFRLWLIITRRTWFIEHNKSMTYIFGIIIPFILSLFSILPQLLKGKNFVIPPDAENCITGYRQNAWQILLSGPFTTLPPFILSSIFGVHIVYVIYKESKQNVIKNVKKFSNISFSSWIRMLWFGILFGFIVVINIIGDFKNSFNMMLYDKPEPGIKGIGVSYCITAAVGFGVFVIFGTTVEAQKKIIKIKNIWLSIPY